MVAIRPNTDFLRQEIKNISFQKRITPFSIDDILANSKSRQSESGEENSFIPSFESGLPSTCISSWNEDLHVKWMASLHRLFLNTYQPFWLAGVHPSTKTLSSCSSLFDSRRQHPYFKADSLVKSSSFSRPAKPYTRKCKKSDNAKTARPKPKTSPKLSTVNENVKRENADFRFRSRSCSLTGCDDRLDEERPRSREDTSDSDSPLGALKKLTCTTFKGMEKKQHELHVLANGREKTKTKRRKSRTAFSAFQLSVLEQRFNCHKYLTPTDRDQISHVLGLTPAQVITWFQNRRAKQKRDLEELKNDLKSVEKSVHQHIHDPKHG